MGRKVWTPGDVWQAADINSFLMNQVVQDFASSTVRSTAIATATEGMVSYLNDSNQVQHYDGTNWQPIPYSVAAGSISITGTGANSATGTVTFPSNRFGVAPIVVACVTANAAFIATVTSATSTQAVITISHKDAASTFSTSQTANWVATSMSIGTAAG